MTTPQIAPISSRARPSSAKREISFRDWHELLAFIQSEIRSSGRTYSDIAADAECCHATVSHMASGQTTAPHLRTAISILVALGYEVLTR